MKPTRKRQLEAVKNVLVVTVIPMIFTIIFATVYSNVFVEELPLAVLDYDQTTTSRMVIDNFEDSEGFYVALTADTQEEVENALLSGDVKAGLILPDHLGADIAAKKSPGVLVLIDGTNIVVGNNAYSYASTILNTLNVGIQVGMLEAGDMVPYVAEQSMTTLSFADRMLYNPQLGYFLFTFAGFLGIFVQQTYMSVSAPIFLEEKARLRRIPVNSSGRRLYIKKMLKQTIPYVGLTFISTLSCLLIAHHLAGYPLNGSLILILLTQAIFLLDLTAVTLFISTFFDDIAHCTQFLMFLSIPTLLTSGYIWPEFAMAPHFAGIIKLVWPLYYYVNPMREILMKGAGLDVIAPYLIGGLIFAAVWLPFTSLMFWRRVRTMKQAEQLQLLESVAETSPVTTTPL